MTMSTSKNNDQNDKNKNQDNCYTVYMHINKINDKKYVGITSRKPELRWQNGTAYKRNPHFNAAIKKYGWDNFEHKIFHNNLSYKDACKYEQKYIKELNLKNNQYGYNMTDGGEGISGFSFTKEQREKMKINNRGENNPMYGRTGALHPMYGKCGETNPNFGRKATDVQRKHISDGRKGIKFSEEHLQHMKESAKRGKDSPVSKSVNMYDKKGVLIQTFDTATDGANYVGANVSNIIKCCKHKIKSSKGYIWEYA